MPIDQTQQTQEYTGEEPTFLRRFTRERRNAITDDFVTFLQELDDNGGMTEDDPISLCHAMRVLIRINGSKQCVMSISQCKTIRFGNLSHY